MKEVVLDIVHYPLAGVQQLFQVEGDKATIGDAIDEKGFHKNVGNNNNKNVMRSAE
ncbi:MAG: hypothetical protein NVS3B25_30900 [Hymenobacter sp.]